MDQNSGVCTSDRYPEITGGVSLEGGGGLPSAGDTGDSPLPPLKVTDKSTTQLHLLYHYIPLNGSNNVKTAFKSSNKSNSAALCRIYLAKV